MCTRAERAAAESALRNIRLKKKDRMAGDWPENVEHGDPRKLGVITCFGVHRTIDSAQHHKETIFYVCFFSQKKIKKSIGIDEPDSQIPISLSAKVNNFLCRLLILTMIQLGQDRPPKFSRITIHKHQRKTHRVRSFLTRPISSLREVRSIKFCCPELGWAVAPPAPEAH